MSERKHFTPESLRDMRGVSDPQIAPDGVRVAYVEHWIETKEGELPTGWRSAYRTAVMLSDGPDAAPRRLTWGGEDSHPRWSPDGQFLAFLAIRDGNKKHLFVLPMGSGEAVPVTTPETLSEGVSMFDWHPGGEGLCFVSMGHKTKADVEHEREHDELVFEGRLPFKYEGKGWFESRRAQLWRVGRDSSHMVQLTHLDTDVQAPRYAPDGKAIAFVRALPEQERTYVTDLHVLDLAAHEVRQLTDGTQPIAAPVWSPDGTRLAFFSHDQHVGNASNVGVWTIHADGSELRCLSEGFDRSAGVTTMGDLHFVTVPDYVVWHDDMILFTATDHGRTGLYSVPADGGTIDNISSSGLSVMTFSAQNGVIAFNGETNTRIAEVYTMSIVGHAVARRSHAADKIARAYSVSAPEHLTLHGADGWELEGWVIKPHDFEETQRYPLLLYIHGGPHFDYGNGFFHEFQVLANAGYGVLFVNPRGGRSYGEAFTAAVSEHFGEKDYDDLMHAADLGASWAWVDPERMGVVGGSYGGYMTNWIVTHTDRFRAACTQRSLSNLYSFAGTSDIGPRFAKEEFGGLPWTGDEALLMQKSPISHIRNCHTPLLILHQEHDYRCPIEQAEQLYTALVCLGVPTKLVRFPAEGHDLSRTGLPHRRINRMQHIIEWFDRYLKG